MKSRQVICVEHDDALSGVASMLDETGWRVFHARTPAVARRAMSGADIRVGLAGFGHGLSSSNDVEAIEELLEQTPEAAWVALVAPDALESARVRRLIALHCHDYLTAPFDTARVRHCVGHAYGMSAMEASVAAAEPPAPIADAGMLGASRIMREAARTLGKFARANAPVTITGESGTGKELAARAIHRRSAQRDGPFVAVNCDAIPENLIQAELFGHTRGAFTGAERDKTGLIESARGGTLFLDEIGDLSLSLQVHLLRFLQKGVIEKVGGDQPIHVDTRVIAATHRNLEQAVADGAFREDLYYRLNILHVHLPPLRERVDDIEQIAGAYLARYASTETARARGFSKAALRALRNHPWPGNVRELVNRIQRAVVMSERRLLAAADLGLDTGDAAVAAKTLEQARCEAEHEAVCRSIREAGQNVAEAARRLGISRATIYRLIDKHAIQMSGDAAAAGALPRPWSLRERGTNHDAQKPTPTH